MNNSNIKIYNIGKDKYESYWLDDKPIDSLSYFDLCKKYKKIMKGEDISNTIGERDPLLQQLKAILKNEIIKRYSRKDGNSNSHNNNCLIVNCTCPLCQIDNPKLTTILSKNSPSWLDRIKLVFNFFNKFFSIINNKNISVDDQNNNNSFTIYLHNSILFSFIYTHRKVLNINDSSTDSEIKRFITDTLAWHPKYFYSGKDDHRLNGCKGYWKMAVQSKDDFSTIYTFPSNVIVNGNNGLIKFLLDSPILLINKTNKKLNYQKSTKRNKLLLSNSEEEDEDSESDSSNDETLQILNNYQSPQPSQYNHKVYGYDLPSILYQMALLQYWSNILDHLSTDDKELIWDTCCYFENFNYFDKDSFSNTLHIWGNNLFSNLYLINILFSTIGYLKEMNEIEGDFYFIDSNIKVFKEFIFIDENSSSGEDQIHSNNTISSSEYENSPFSSRNNSPISFEREINGSNESNLISLDKLSIKTSSSPSTSPTLQLMSNLQPVINNNNNNTNIKLDNLQLASKPTNIINNNIFINNNNNNNSTNNNENKKLNNTSELYSSFNLNNNQLSVKKPMANNSSVIFNMIEKNKETLDVTDKQKEKQIRIEELTKNEEKINEKIEPSTSLAYLSSLLSLSKLSNFVNNNNEIKLNINKNNNINIDKNKNNSNNNNNNNNNNNININNLKSTHDNNDTNTENKTFVNNIKNLLNSSNGSVNFIENNNNFIKQCTGCNKRHYSEMECKEDQRISKKLNY